LIAEKQEPIAVGEKQKTVLPANKSSHQTVVAAPTRKIKRNNLLVAAVAASVIIGLGLFFIAVNLFSTSAAEFFEKGLDCATKQDYDCAISNYGKAIELKPDYVEAYKHRAVNYYTNGDFEQAILDYNRAVELNPNDAAAFYGRGSAFLNSGDYERAIQDYTRAAELAPQEARYVYSRGLTYFNKKDLKKR
jgi:tetratricopeptide (TPR) repeat protein